MRRAILLLLITGIFINGFSWAMDLYGLHPYEQTPSHAHHQGDDTGEHTKDCGFHNHCGHASAHLIALAGKSSLNVSAPELFFSNEITLNLLPAYRQRLERPPSA